MSYKNFKRPKFIKELDKTINNITTCRNHNNISKSHFLTTSEKEFIAIIDKKLKDLQVLIQEKKMQNVQAK